MKIGTTRAVIFVGSYAIKLPRLLNGWKCFLRGILANLDEIMWYKHSPLEWQEKMCPSIFTIGGLLLIAKRAHEITEEEYGGLTLKYFEPLPCDIKKSNFGKYKGKIVLVDYADTRYFCSDCERIFIYKFNPLHSPKP